jgi:hypothetical protein
MLEEMPFKQLLEWEAFDRLEPVGGLRGDWQTAAMCSTMMNIAAARSGSKKRFRPQDFLLEFSDEKAPLEEIEPVRQTWQEMKMIGMMMVASSQATDRRKRRG